MAEHVALGGAEIDRLRVFAPTLDTFKLQRGARRGGVGLLAADALVAGTIDLAVAEHTSHSRYDSELRSDSATSGIFDAAAHPMSRASGVSALRARPRVACRPSVGPWAVPAPRRPAPGRFVRLLRVNSLYLIVHCAYLRSEDTPTTIRSRRAHSEQ